MPRRLRSMDRDRIVIKRDQVIHEDMTDRRRIPISAFWKALGRATTQISPLLPGSGTRLYGRTEGKAFLVFEEEPALRTIHVEYREEQGYYTLAFPYMVFILVMQRFSHEQHLETLAAYARPAPLASLTDQLFYPCLPNIQPDTGGMNFVCQPDTGQLPYDLEQAVKQVIGGFWQQTFTDDRFGEDYPSLFYRAKKSRHFDPRLASFGAWQKASQRDQGFALRARWRPTELTLGEMVGRLSKRGHSAGEAFSSLRAAIWDALEVES